MELPNTPVNYKEKLIESLALSSNLLEIQAGVYTETQASNGKFQALLEQIAANGQQELFLFESIGSSLTPELNAKALEIISLQVRANQELLELFKNYKTLEEKISYSIDVIAPQVTNLVKS
jgi:hypothetical protein